MRERSNAVFLRVSPSRAPGVFTLQVSGVGGPSLALSYQSHRSSFQLLTPEFFFGQIGASKISLKVNVELSTRKLLFRELKPLPFSVTM